MKVVFFVCGSTKLHWSASHGVTANKKNELPWENVHSKSSSKPKKNIRVFNHVGRFLRLRIHHASLVSVAWCNRKLGNEPTWVRSRSAQTSNQTSNTKNKHIKGQQLSYKNLVGVIWGAWIPPKQQSAILIRLAGRQGSVRTPHLHCTGGCPPSAPADRS